MRNSVQVSIAGSCPVGSAAARPPVVKRGHLQPVANRFVVPAHQAGNRFLGTLKSLQIRALVMLPGALHHSGVQAGVEASSPFYIHHHVHEMPDYIVFLKRTYINCYRHITSGPALQRPIHAGNWCFTHYHGTVHSMEEPGEQWLSS